jgi:hypothetical protein
VPTEEDFRKDAMPIGFIEALAIRIGEGSIESFRTVAGNPAATFEDMDNASRARFSRSSATGKT